MLSFISKDTYNIRNKKVFIVINDQDRDNSKEGFQDYYPEIIIDDKTYKTVGVERYCIPTIRKGLPVGVLVD